VFNGSLTYLFLKSGQ